MGLGQRPHWKLTRAEFPFIPSGAMMSLNTDESVEFKPRPVAGVRDEGYLALCTLVGWPAAHTSIQHHYTTAWRIE